MPIQSQYLLELITLCQRTFQDGRTVSNSDVAAVRKKLQAFDEIDVGLSTSIFKELCQRYKDSTRALFIDCFSSDDVSIIYWIYPKGAKMQLHDHPGQISFVKATRGTVGCTCMTLHDPNFRSAATCRIPLIDLREPRLAKKIARRNLDLLRVKPPSPSRGTELQVVTEYEGVLRRQGCLDNTLVSFPHTCNMHHLEAIEPSAIVTITTPSKGVGRCAMGYELVKGLGEHQIDGQLRSVEVIRVLGEDVGGQCVQVVVCEEGDEQLSRAAREMTGFPPPTADALLPVLSSRRKLHSSSSGGTPLLFLRQSKEGFATSSDSLGGQSLGQDLGDSSVTLGPLTAKGRFIPARIADSDGTGETAVAARRSETRLTMRKEAWTRATKQASVGPKKAATSMRTPPLRPTVAVASPQGEERTLEEPRYYESLEARHARHMHRKISMGYEPVAAIGPNAQPADLQDWLLEGTFRLPPWAQGQTELEFSSPFWRGESHGHPPPRHEEEELLPPEQLLGLSWRRSLPEMVPLVEPRRTPN